jgi:hypothetical protein
MNDELDSRAIIDNYIMNSHNLNDHIFTKEQLDDFKKIKTLKHLLDRALTGRYRLGEPTLLKELNVILQSQTDKSVNNICNIIMDLMNPDMLFTKYLDIINGNTNILKDCKSLIKKEFKELTTDKYADKIHELVRELISYDISTSLALVHVFTLEELTAIECEHSEIEHLKLPKTIKAILNADIITISEACGLREELLNHPEICDQYTIVSNEEDNFIVIYKKSLEEIYDVVIYPIFRDAEDSMKEQLIMVFYYKNTNIIALFDQNNHFCSKSKAERMRVGNNTCNNHDEQLEFLLNSLNSLNLSSSPYYKTPIIINGDFNCFPKSNLLTSSLDPDAITSKKIRFLTVQRIKIGNRVSTNIEGTIYMDPNGVLRHVSAVIDFDGNEITKDSGFLPSRECPTDHRPVVNVIYIPTLEMMMEMRTQMEMGTQMVI